MTDFIDISKQGYNPKEVKTITDSLDNYIHFAETTNKAVKCFVMTPLKFREWYKYCKKYDLPLETYKDIPIVIDHDEQKLNLLTMLIKDKDW